jgi:hypothetical protein
LIDVIRKIVGFVLIFAIVACAIYLFTRGKAPFSVGEMQVYDVYYRDENIGSLTFRIADTGVVEGAKCYVARYSLILPRLDTARSGILKFDEGNLRRAVIAEAEGRELKWRTEIGYSFAENRMRVIVEDNRDPENFKEKDVYIGLTAEIRVPEHVWYLWRLEPLRLGYRREFHLNLFPDATLNVLSAFEVIGEERVQTPAGTFDSWVIEGKNTALVAWPVDRVWVAKKDGIVVKALENVAGHLSVYKLREIA